MNVLVIYDSYSPLKPRQALIDHLYSFGKYSDNKVYYCNYAYGLPRYLKKVSFDLIIFHYFFATQFRWNGLPYESYLSRLEPLKESSAKKALFCQDEYVKMGEIGRFIEEYGISHLFTVADSSQWSTIYPEVDRSKVEITQVLTGYLDDEIEELLAKLQEEKIPRTIEIGYRASHINPALGRLGKLKIDVAEAVAAAAPSMNNSIKTVTDEKEMFAGWDWYRFLLSCKGTIGVEGGSSLLDSSGAITARVKEYRRRRPGTSFEEVEEACFPGIDGNLNLVALSPRHLEACATRTCQLLVEGDYSGILKPGVHYLALKRDFSNVKEILKQFQDPLVRQKITEQAYNDIVASGRYRYSSFVEEVFSALAVPPSSRRSPYYLINKLREGFLKRWMRLEFLLFPTAKKLLPRRVAAKLKALRNRC